MVSLVLWLITVFHLLWLISANMEGGVFSLLFYKFIYAFEKFGGILRMQLSLSEMAMLKVKIIDCED